MPPTETKPAKESLRLTRAKSRVGVPSADRNRKGRRSVPWAWLTRVPALCALLALATAFIYAPVIKHEFINYDDDVYILNNPHVTSGWTWQNVRWALTSDAAGNWHPVTWLSHALDCQIYGIENAAGHHATSLLLHVLNVVLLFLFLSWVTGARGRSFVVAGLFALHPFNVESVAWVAERKNVLCTFFFLLALLAYAWYVRRPRLDRYLLIGILFVLGLASKPMVITLPFVLLLLDFWPLGRVKGWSAPAAAFPVEQKAFPRLLVEKLPLIALSAASAVITMAVQARGKVVASLSDLPLSWRLQNAVWAYATYLWKTFVPIGLAPFYPTSDLKVWVVLLSAVFLLVISWLVWKLRSSRPYLAVGYLWFLGTLVPVIGIVQVGSQSMADRYAYIPLIGVFIAVVWGLEAAAGANSRWLVVAASLALVGSSLVTWRQLGYWKDGISLWSHTLQVTTDNFVAEEDLAVDLANQGRDDEALPHFVIAQKIRPTDDTATMNIGINLESRGLHDLAIKEFDQVIRLNTNPAKVFEAHRREGVIYAQLGDLQKSRAHLMQAVQLSPFDPSLLQDLAMLEANEAADKFSKSLPANPSAQQYFQLGQLLEQGFKVNQAKAAYEKALKIDPGMKEARQALLGLADAKR